MPGPGHKLIGLEELKQVTEVMQSGYLFRYGDLNETSFRHKVYTFEQELAEHCGVKHALAVSSGSAALICALKAIDLQPGDEVIVPAYTFIASFSAIIFCGGVPVLAEINESLNIDPADIEKRITPKTRVIMPVHMLGNACDMDAILDIADRHNLIVIEDACQANGGTYHGKALGSLGSIGAFSLNIFKTITSGDGGALITNDTDLYTRAFAFHDQGHLPNRTGVEVGTRSILGLNFRVNELTGAVALAQLHKLDDILVVLREKKRKLKSLLADIPGLQFRILPDPDGECATLCTVLFENAETATRVAHALGATTVEHSGWHVYSNMEHLNRWLVEHNLPHGVGAYPQTDDILSRAINISVGVVDAGLGAGFGIHIFSSDEDIREVAERVQKACRI